MEFKETPAWLALCDWAHHEDGKGISAEAEAWADEEIGLCGVPANARELRAMLSAVFESGRRYERALAEEEARARREESTVEDGW